MGIRAVFTKEERPQLVSHMGADQMHRTAEGWPRILSLKKGQAGRTPTAACP